MDKIPTWVICTNAGWRSTGRRYQVLKAASKEFSEVLGNTFTLFWNQYEKAEDFACISGNSLFNIETCVPVIKHEFWEKKKKTNIISEMWREYFNKLLNEDSIGGVGTREGTSLAGHLLL